MVEPLALHSQVLEEVRVRVRTLVDLILDLTVDAREVEQRIAFGFIIIAGVILIFLVRYKLGHLH